MMRYAMSMPLAHSGDFHALQWIVLLAAVAIPVVAMTIVFMVGGREK